MVTMSCTSSAVWAELASERFIQLSVQAPESSFAGELTSLDLGGGARLSRVTTTPLRIARTPALARSDDRDDVLFLMNEAGSIDVLRAGTATRLPTGAATVHDARQPYALVFGSRATSIVLQVPAAALGGFRREALGVVEPIETTARVLLTFAREVLAAGDAMSDGERGDLGQSAVQILRAVLHASDRAPTAHLGGRAMLAVMQQFIREHSDDPDLTPADVAARHHVSLRYMQRLFADAGQSPAAYLHDERMARAIRLLADPREIDRPISAIASASGFALTDTFIRSFRRRFGRTPGEYRRSATSHAVEHAP
jgi:AraC-like DNA-binding protein